MTITLDIKPEVQAELARQAAVQGCPSDSCTTHCVRRRDWAGGRDWPSAH